MTAGWDASCATARSAGHVQRDSPCRPVSCCLAALPAATRAPLQAGRQDSVCQVHLCRLRLTRVRTGKGPNRQGSEPARVRNPYTEALPRNLTLNPNQHHAPGNHRCTISLYASQSAGSGPTKAARQNVRSSDMWWPTAGRPQPRMASNTAVAPAARWMAATRSCARARRAPSREA